MTKYRNISTIQVANDLYNFVQVEVLNGLDLDSDEFWRNASIMIGDLDKKNKELLKDRVRMQELLDQWKIKNKGKKYSVKEYEAFLRKIGYILPEGEEFKISTENIDPEICEISGPQLVVPITNARYAINAANARWGSLYNAVYGSDILGIPPCEPIYSAERGLQVVNWAKKFLDESVPLEQKLWSDITEIKIISNELMIFSGELRVELVDSSQFKGSLKNNLETLLLFRNNQLGIIIEINPGKEVGKRDPAQISDIFLESAVSVIMDLEDSVSTVDISDKINAYRNWLGLMTGQLTESFKKEGIKITRNLEPNKIFVNPEGSSFTEKGRALMLVRNVGHLMTTNLVLNQDGSEVGEGLIDCLITAACALHDFSQRKEISNSVKKSIYIVKPKMHGPVEVAFANELFERVESIFRLPPNTLKLGIMDEERRTSLNLKECIREAKSRVCFINTGFLDRTGDEIHSSMELGPMLRKADIKKQKWIEAYEKNNVQCGLNCGFMGRAQIGKGMWAMPEKLSEMLTQKKDHLTAGGSCAWVPSPTAAIIHAIHYHQISVRKVQQKLLHGPSKDFTSDLLQVPILDGMNLSRPQVEEELMNNIQSILGYVVKWVNQGVGCSKVPDFFGVNLMEDRATCRISSQHISNWLHHGLITEADILDAFDKMIKMVNLQNSKDPLYEPISAHLSDFSFRAAHDLCIHGRLQPNGYTEPILHENRVRKKAKRNTHE